MRYCIEEVQMNVIEISVIGISAIAFCVIAILMILIIVHIKRIAIFAGWALLGFSVLSIIGIVAGKV